MFRSTAVRLTPGRPLTIHNNPYKAQKKWPPDFSKLPVKYQFNFERRYKRRAKLKWTRPGWVRGVKLFSYVSCGGTFVYGVLFMDWKNEFGQDDKPFQGIRDMFWGSLDSIWTSKSKPIPDRANVSEKDATIE